VKASGLTMWSESCVAGGSEKITYFVALLLSVSRLQGNTVKERWNWANEERESGTFILCVVLFVEVRMKLQRLGDNIYENSLSLSLSLSLRQKSIMNDSVLFSVS